MRHLVICQRQKAPNFSAFHWSPHGCLITIGQHFVTTRVVHLPKRTETSLITKQTKADLITSYCNYSRPTQPGPIRTRLCGPCIAALAGFVTHLQLLANSECIFLFNTISCFCRLLFYKVVNIINNNLVAVYLMKYSKELK